MSSIYQVKNKTPDFDMRFGTPMIITGTYINTIIQSNESFMLKKYVSF